MHNAPGRAGPDGYQSATPLQDLCDNLNAVLQDMIAEQERHLTRMRGVQLAFGALSTTIRERIETPKREAARRGHDRAA